MRVFPSVKTPFVPRIRIINLVDVLFILLIFFIATSTFRVASQQPSAVKLSLPDAKSGEAVGKSKLNQLRIVVDAAGVIYLDDKKLAAPALEKMLADAKAKNEDVTIELSADKNVSYGVIVGVVDAARVAGIKNITAFTKKSVQ